MFVPIRVISWIALGWGGRKTRNQTNNSAAKESTVCEQFIVLAPQCVRFYFFCSTMSFFWVPTKAINSSFSAVGTLYLSSAATKCFAAASH